ASLDQVSKGRFLFGIGGGWNQDEMEDHGTVFATRFKKMREQVEAMKEIWTKSKPEYHGDIVDFPPMMTWPKPVQNPHPPVIVGADDVDQLKRYRDMGVERWGAMLPAEDTEKTLPRLDHWSGIIRQVNG